MWSVWFPNTDEAAVEAEARLIGDDDDDAGDGVGGIADADAAVADGDVVDKL